MKKLFAYLSTFLLILVTLVPSLANAVSENPNAGKGEQGFWSYRTVAPGFEEESQSTPYDFYTMVDKNGQESIVYCYDAQKPQPAIDKEQAEKECTFERFGFYDGMENLGTDRGDKEKIDTIAAILMAGYPNDGLGKAMDDYAKECYQKMTDRNYTFADFKREMTQRAIWKADKPRGNYTDGFPYAEALYQYGVTHPLNKETAYADTLTFMTANKEVIDAKHPLMISSKTLKSDVFTIDNYDGIVTVNNLTNGFKLIDADTNKETTAIEAGKKYYIQVDNKNTTTATMDIKYMKMKDSYFYQYVTSPYPYGMQNMVQANIDHKEIPFQIKMEEEVTSTSDSSSTTESTSVENTKSHDSINTTESTTTTTATQTTRETSLASDSSSTTESTTQEGSITFDKVDPNGKLISGASLTLKDVTANKETAFVSDGKTKTFTVTYDHEYVLSETNAPQGYQLAQPITFRMNQYGFIEVKENGSYTQRVRLCEVLQDEVVNEKDVLNDNTTVTVNKKSNIAHTNDCGHIDEDGFEDFEKMTYKQLKDKINHLTMVDELVNKKEEKVIIEQTEQTNDDGWHDDSQQTGALPKTGNKKNTMLTVLGGVIVIAVIACVIVIIRKKK